MLLLLSLIAVVVESSFDPEDPVWRRHKLGDDSSEFWLDTPKRSLSAGGFYYDVVIDGRRERFWLRNKPQLLSNDLIHIIRDGDNSTVQHGQGEDCAFEGHSLSHNGSSIALYGCGVDLHGLVITSTGDYIFIQPQDREHPQHIIRKRSTATEHTCLFDPSTDPYPEDQRSERQPRSHLIKKNRKEEKSPIWQKEAMTIELAVFADDTMWRHFHRMYGSHADIELHKFIMAAVNNIDILFSQRSIQPRIKVKVVRYEVLKTPPRTLEAWIHRSGDVDKLLDAFCQYQYQINSPYDQDPRHWDHALLFSGHDLYREGLYTVAGYAPVKGMCTGSRSCTINEGLDFGSVFVVTHEMGHSLGMYHDGDNECDLRCCIMSPSVGSGKTHWSRCSVKEMRQFLGRMGSDGRTTNCLMDAPLREEENPVPKDRESPGQLFTLDDQCEIFHGECWKHELKDGQVLENVCSMAWCGNGEGIIRTAHPALEGSNCGYNKQCRNGLCIQVNEILPYAHGGWSAWNDNPAPVCGGQCSECKVQGQIRLKRSIRRCNNPSTLNNGAPCQGSDARGIKCSDQICSGMSPNQYAAQECKRARDDPNMPNPLLTGEGLQFQLAPCKVWCQLAGSNNIRTVANFPDGTPCGGGGYCVKGECRSLQCQGAAVVAAPYDCPIFGTPAPAIQYQTKKPSPYKEEKKPPFWQQWSGWSEWSACVTVACGTTGYRLRARRCLAGECVGQSKQKGDCYGPPCPATSFATTTTANTRQPDFWGPWSGCSVSCGTGQRIRRRKNCVNGCTETATCTMAACPSQPRQGLWSEWSMWAPCSTSCGTGSSFRLRACSTSFCPGPERESRKCFERACPVASFMPPVTAPPSSTTTTRRLPPSSTAMSPPVRDISWTEWGPWSRCTKQCGTGTKIRRRQCLRAPCPGDFSETNICVGTTCDKWRIPRATPPSTTVPPPVASSTERHHGSGSTAHRHRQL